MNIEFHPDARLELSEAAHYYESQQRFLGERLLAAVEDALTHIERFPAMFSEIENGIRKCRVTRFPYALIYQVRDETIQVIALAHLRQRPNYWKRRIQ